MQTVVDWLKENGGKTAAELGVSADR